jgi:hypothetical protein
MTYCSQQVWSPKTASFHDTWLCYKSAPAMLALCNCSVPVTSPAATVRRNTELNWTADSRQWTTVNKSNYLTCQQVRSCYVTVMLGSDILIKSHQGFQESGVQVFRAVLLFWNVDCTRLNPDHHNSHISNRSVNYRTIDIHCVLLTIHT